MKLDYAEIMINTYPFYVVSVNKNDIPNCDGQTIHNDRLIKIRDDLDYLATKLVLTHEITHALLGTQGRVFQTKFNVEELCEFMAYQSRYILDLVERVVEQRGKEDE